MKNKKFIFITVFLLFFIGNTVSQENPPPVITLIENVSLRSVNSKTVNVVEDGVPTDTYKMINTIAPIHYETDSGEFEEINLSIKRIDNSLLDGWLATTSNWHYALGSPGDKSTDGWVGFGGNQGEHWFESRVSRIGYLQWSTKEFDDISGSPTYNRAYLQNEVNQIEVFDKNLSIETVAKWSNIWTTPDNGNVSVEWKVRGDGLKEEVIINDNAWEWLKTNRPSTTPATDTFFGVVFQLDWNDIPKIYLDGLLQNLDNDFSTDLGNITLTNAQNEFLGFMPVSDLITRNITDGTVLNTTVLRKRFYVQNGNPYLLVGVRVDKAAQLPRGDKAFDPTVESQVSASSDDAKYTAALSTVLTDNIISLTSGAHWAGFRFQNINVPQGTQIDSATFEWWIDLRDDPNFNVYAEDSDNAVTFTAGGTDLIDRTLTTAYANIDLTGVGNDDWYSMSVITPVQEVLDRGGFSSGNAIVFIIDELDSQSDIDFEAYDSSASLAAKLTIVYTGGDVTAPIVSVVINESTTNESSLIKVVTDEAANLTVNYGTTVSLGTYEYNTTFQTTTYGFLESLTNNTLYYYNTTSCDVSGNCQQNGTFSFSTSQNPYSGDDVDPIVSVVTNESTTNESTLIKVVTDEATNLTVNYGTTVSLGSFVYNTTYETTTYSFLDSLTNGTLYYYNTTACDVSGNCQQNGSFSFTTSQNYDIWNPKVSVVINESTTNESSLIKVVTDEASNLTINYGTTVSLGTFVYNTTYETTTYGFLDSLTNNTLYYYNITACDTWGNCQKNGSFSFTTSQNPYIITYGTLSVELLTPADNTAVTQYDTFDINATVTCSGGDCGTVYANARYNYSGSLPDTLINSTSGDFPLYTLGGSTYYRPIVYYNIVPYSNPEYGYDNNYGDTTTYVHVNSVPALEYIYTVPDASGTFYYTTRSDNPSSIKLHNYSNGGWFDLQVASATITERSYEFNKDDFVNSTNNMWFGVKGGFGPNTELYDTYVVQGSGGVTSSELSAGESFNVTWTVNATGSTGERYEVDVLVNSSYGSGLVGNSHSSDSTICIGESCEAPVDSCTTNTWDCTESCTVTGLNAGGNVITASGIGQIVVSGDVTNCNDGGEKLKVSGGCEVKIINGARLC